MECKWLGNLPKSNLGLFLKQNALHITSLMSNWGASYQKGLISPLSLVLGVRMRKQFIQNHDLQIFCKCKILPLTPASRSSGVIILKNSCIALLLVLGFLNVKTTYKKSWPANLLQTSNLTFEPCFKI